MVKPIRIDPSGDLQRSLVNAIARARIARADKAATKARWQTPAYPVANLEPRDRRTREYREWVARQAQVS